LRCRAWAQAGSSGVWTSAAVLARGGSSAQPARSRRRARRYLDASCLLFGADREFLEVIDFDRRMSSGKVGAPGEPP